MPEFDPYFKWLGIPLEDQPPDHYRLLGIPAFTSDADVIVNAVDRRVAFVRTFALGSHSDDSQRILNELAAARVCLESPEKKAVYDNSLGARVRETQQVVGTSEASPTEPTSINGESTYEARSSRRTPQRQRSRTSRRRRSGTRDKRVIGMIGAATTLIGLIVFLWPELPDPAADQDVAGSTKTKTPNQPRIGAAVVAVEGMVSIPFTIKSDPTLIPEHLRGASTWGFPAKVTTSEKNAVLRFNVLQGGEVFLIAHWKYEGKKTSDNWHKERLTKKELIAQGWQDLGPCAWDEEIFLFKKTVKQSEMYVIRTNKYWPPKLVTRVASPPPAISPFDAAQAKQYQKAWAEYLDVPKANETELIDVIPPFSSSSRTQSFFIPIDTTKLEIGIIRGGWTKETPAWKHAGRLGVLTVDGRIVLRYVKRYRDAKGTTHTLFSAFDGSQVNTRLPESCKGVFDITQFAKPGKELVVSYRHKQINPALGVRIHLYRDTKSIEITNSIGMKLKLIPAGQFQMGYPPIGEVIPSVALYEEEDKKHPVSLTDPIYAGVYEVTRDQFQLVLSGEPDLGDEEYGSHPVTSVSWETAVKFCQELSERDEEKEAARTYRLPTEAEWEYMCRAGTTTAFSFGSDQSELGNYGWYSRNSGGRTHPVGQKLPNAFGLYDMHGNVWEWCSDWYAVYPVEATVDPRGPSEGQRRVSRGGGYKHTDGFAMSSNRNQDNLEPGAKHVDLGFRVVCEIKTVSSGK